MVAVLVIGVNLAIFVAVNIEALDRISIHVVNLLINKERIWCKACLVNLDVVTSTTGNATCLNAVVISTLVISCKFGYDCLVPGNVCTDFPVPVPCLDRNCIDFEFDTSVLKVTDVCIKIVGKVGTCCNWSPVEKVLGVAFVELNGSVDAVFNEAIVNTNVVCRCGFPLQVSIVSVRSDWLNHGCAKIILAGVGVVCVGSKGRIVAGVEVLLSCLTITQPEFESRYSLAVLEEWFILDAPSESHRREEAPFVVLEP